MLPDVTDIEESSPTDGPSGDDSFTLTGYPTSIPYVALKSMVVRG